MLAKSPKVTRYIEVLQQLCYLHHRSDCFRLERPVAGWDSHPLEIADFHGIPDKLEYVRLAFAPRPPRAIRMSCNDVRFIG